MDSMWSLLLPLKPWMCYDYIDIGCMLGRAPRTKGTLPHCRENMNPYKWDRIVWYQATRIAQELHGLTGCQQDLGFGASQ